MQSIWSENVKLPRFEPLHGDTDTEVLIIGGGMAGLLCAYMLQQAGVPYLLVEANRICRGVTENTTAKLTVQHGLIYSKLLKEFGAETAKGYLRANEQALVKYRELCRSISCDYEEKSSFIYSRDEHHALDKELQALERIGCPARYVEQLPLPFSVAGAVELAKQGQFHPLKFAAAIAEGLHIHENTTVWELVGTTAVTDAGRIKAGSIIVATHFPFINKHGSYFLKMYQHRSYELALQNAPLPNGMYMDASETGFSFRTAGDLLLLGGGGHRTGKQGGQYEALERFAKEHYPHAILKARWATQDCMTLDGVPYIGRYSASTDGLYVATGFNKWGMSSSMVAAMLLCDMVQGKHNEFEKIFTPSRTVMRPQLACNALEAIKSLLTPTAKRCPLLGCALKWNKAEHSWDCPCHGSRFTENGELIDNPATGDLKKKL